MTKTLDDTLARLDAALADEPTEDADPARLSAILADAQASVPWPRLLDALFGRVSRDDSPRDRLALVLHATDAEIAGAERGKGDLAKVFEVIVAAADAPALEDYLARCQLLLEQHPELRGDLPTVARLIEIADQIEDAHETTADGLVSLAQQIEDLDESARLAEEAATTADD